MPTFVYREVEGKIQSVLVSEKPKLLRGTPDCMRMGFHEKLLDGYKQSEAKGDRWQGPHSKSKVKQIHERAAERDAAQGIAA